MLISASATRRAYTHGFTLLEVLVVVTLLALFASLVMPLMNQRSIGGDIDDQFEHMASTLQLIAENSVFRGELLAVSLTAEGYTPLRFDPTENEFVSFADDQSLQPFSFPENQTLEWEIDSESSSDISLGDSMQLVMSNNSASATTNSAQDSVDEEAMPQLYFFPSGEATAVTFILRDHEADEELKFSLDTVGRISRDQDEDATP